MERIIVQPPVPGDAALAELKHWLGINRPNDDDSLRQLLASSLAICEAFTGKTPLQQTVEETILLVGGWQELVARPVSALSSAAVLGDNGQRTPITTLSDALAWRIGSSACVRLLRTFEGQGVVLQLVTGIAADWASLPAPLRQGIIRLAAHHFREREGAGANKTGSAPPASVTALWRPWREMRL